jgi:hypothetical protein
VEANPAQPDGHFSLLKMRRESSRCAMSHRRRSQAVMEKCDSRVDFAEVDSSYN